jgi:hypothetical protein
MRRFSALPLAVGGVLILASGAGARVLRVGIYHGIRRQFGSIQAAVDHAKAGDWILIGPGDYKTTSSSAPAGASDHPAAVLITTLNLRIRGDEPGFV